jgi:methionyl-tRNA formyltransferase
MRIEFLTQDDPLYILSFFEEFFRHYASEFEIIQVSCCRTMGSRPRSRMIRELACLYGLRGFSRLALRSGTARLLGLLPRPKDATGFHSMKQLCRAWRIPLQRIGNPNTAAFIDQLASRAPDLILSVACPYIFKEQLLKLAPLGCVNIHHAPLPKYQGMMPTFWQMFHDEHVVGLTIHYIAEKVDRGPALLQESLVVEPGESLDHLIRRSKRHGAHCMARVVRQIASQTQSVITLDQSAASYFTFPTIKQIREFRRRGFRAL